VQQVSTHAGEGWGTSAHYHEAGHPANAVVFGDFSKFELADVFAFLHGLHSLWACVASDAAAGEEDLPCLGIPLEVNEAVVLDNKLTCRFVVAADETVVLCVFHDCKFFELIIY